MIRPVSESATTATIGCLGNMARAVRMMSDDSVQSTSSASLGPFSGDAVNLTTSPT